MPIYYRPRERRKLDLRWPLFSGLLLLGWLVWSTFAGNIRQLLAPRTVAMLALSSDASRQYCLVTPSHIDARKTYWLLVVVHGSGGNARGMAEQYMQPVLQRRLDCLILAPQLRDDLTFQFPTHGEGAVLTGMIADVRARYRVHEKILLAGFSAGAQFAHRYALQLHPELVQACAASSAGSWTLPDDGKIVSNQYAIPPEANYPVLPAARAVPFFISCGTRDTTRLDAAKQFVAALRSHDYSVTTLWPDTEHQLTPEVIARSLDFLAAQTY